MLIKYLVGDLTDSRINCLQRMPKEMAASYGQVNCSKPTVEKEKLILALYAVFSAISIVFYVTAIALIVKSRAYRRLLHRLTLYLAIGGILRSLAYVLQVLPVDVEQADNSTVTVRKGWEGVCVFAGFMIQYTGLIQPFTVLWICLYLFRMVLFQKRSEKIGHEVIGLVAAYLVPHLFTWEPFITDSYGLLGTRCWIVDNDCNSNFDLAFAYEMALNVVPNFTVTLMGLILMAITIAALVRKFILKVLQLHQWAAIKEILPLAIYPTLFMLILLARLIALVSGNYTYDASVAFASLIQMCSAALPVSLLMRSNLRNRLCCRKKRGEKDPLMTSTNNGGDIEDENIM